MEERTRAQSIKVSFYERVNISVEPETDMKVRERKGAGTWKGTLVPNTDGWFLSRHGCKD